jgi:hypothetical protein
MRKLNTTMVETRILTNKDHPIMDSKIQGAPEYVMKAGTPQPIFMKAIEIFGNQEVNVRKVETTPAYTRPPTLGDENEMRDLTMCAIPKEASEERIKAQFTSLMADEYEEYGQFYTDGLLKDEKDEILILKIQNSKRS